MNISDAPTTALPAALQNPQAQQQKKKETGPARRVLLTAPNLPRVLGRLVASDPNRDRTAPRSGPCWGPIGAQQEEKKEVRARRPVKVPPIGARPRPSLGLAPLSGQTQTPPKAQRPSRRLAKAPSRVLSLAVCLSSGMSQDTVAASNRLSGTIHGPP